MIQFSLTLLILTAPFSFAQDLTFSEVYEMKIMGIDSLQENERDQLIEDAKAYAHYRKYPKSTKATDLWQSCHDDPKSNVLCDIVLNPRENGAAVPVVQAVRAKFLAALMSLDNPKERSKHCVEALKILQPITKDENLSSLHGRALYWSWICAKALKKSEDADELKERLWSEFPLSHHTLLVLEQDKDLRATLAATEEQDWPVLLRSEKVPELNAWIAAIETLQKIGEDGAAAVAALHINSKIRDLEPEVRLYLAALMSQVSESVPSVLPVSRILVPLFIDRHEYMAPSTLKLLFPVHYQFQKVAQESASILELVNEYRKELNAPLMLGLIHQESALNPRAASSAGAFGLTQMLLPTATDQYRKLMNDPKATVDRDLLFKPRISVQLGFMDFRWRMAEFKNNLILTLASYNAGVAGVKKWTGEIKKIQTPELLNDVLFMNRAPEFHVSQYVSMIQARAAWYAKLYPALKPAQ